MAEHIDTPHAEGTPRRRERRRATAPASAPSVEAPPVSSETRSTMVAAQPAEAVVVAPAPQRRRRRAVAAPAGPPQVVELPQAENRAEPKTSVAPQTEGVTDAPVEKPRRSRNSRRAAEPAEKKTEPSAQEETRTESAPTGEVAKEETEQASQEEGRPSQRKRRSRSGKRKDAQPEKPQEADGTPEVESSENKESAEAASAPVFVAPGREDRSAILDDLANLAQQHKASPQDEEKAQETNAARLDFASLLFQAPVATTVGEPDAEDEDEAADEENEDGAPQRRRRRRGGRGRRGRGRSEENSEEESSEEAADETSDDEQAEESSTRRRRRRRRNGSQGEEGASDDPPNTVVRVREGRDEVRAVKGSTRLEAKKQRRRESRDAGRRKTSITEAEFLARREAVKRSMVVREAAGRTQIAVLEDDILVEHYVARKSQTSMVGNVYLGKVQNVLPSMEAAFVDIDRGRNAVLYAGEVNWDAAGLDGQPRRIELALKPGDSVLVQVTKDPIGHKGARLTSQISLPGRYLVFVPGGSMTGISRKLPDNERTRLKKIMRQIIPKDAGVIVRTAAEGASEEELTRDVERLRKEWERIQKAQGSKSAPAPLSNEPDLVIKVVRDVFNEDFTSLVVQGDKAYKNVHDYVSSVAPDLLDRVTKHVGEKDVFAKHRIDEQLLKAMDRKVYLPSGGSLVIDRTEAMTVIDVNTGKFTGAGGSLEETVTKNNLEAAEEIVRQLRLRDIGGIIVVDFIDMVLEANRDLVLRRLVECLSRDRTKHQVAEVTSLGLVQMTRKRVGQGLVEMFSHDCEHCHGRGIVIDMQGNTASSPSQQEKEAPAQGAKRSRKAARAKRGTRGNAKESVAELVDEKNASDVQVLANDDKAREIARATIASIAAAASTHHETPEVTVAGQVVTPESASPEAETEK
ncbi:Rne/Rng family ribonuclease [Dermabacteraceae bacterium TAE3-ERU27]|nr:Rne/Rng family ribonuclease [Dermabacteraceae bacterium TAE3-ERU27]